MASPPQNTAHKPTLSLPPEHAEAAAICCSLFEQKVVPYLCRGHERADRKLTSSERLRIVGAFFLEWQIILATPANDLPAVQKRIACLSATDQIYLHDIAQFMLGSINAEGQRNIAKLMGYTTDVDVFVRMLDVVRALHACFNKVGMRGLHQPDYAPLNLGLFFDDWQEDYVKTQAEAYQKLLNEHSHIT